VIVRPEDTSDNKTAARIAARMQEVLHCNKRKINIFYVEYSLLSTVILFSVGFFFCDYVT
jgi:hypothetical protein